MDNEMNIDLAVLYLTGKANEEELQEFILWLNASPENQKYYQYWAECWKATGRAYGHMIVNTDNAWNQVSKQTVYLEMNNKGQRSLYFYSIRIAAAIIILVTMGFIVRWLSNSGFFSNEQFIAYSSGSDTLTVHLSDGTRVCLNKYCTLRAPAIFKNPVRKVFLDGEAYFDVARDTTRPFKIITQNMITEVLGTSFNLMAKKNENIFKLTLIKGKVALYENLDKTKKLVLLPGQEGIYNISSETFTKETVKDLNMLAWKTGKLQFDNACPEVLCNILSTYYRVNVIYAKQRPAEKTELFTGTFDNLPLEKTLNIINKTINVKISKTGDHILILYM